jgi:ribosomal protein S18 acetylase RimI-like enzyme
MHIRQYEETDQARVIELWRRCDLVRPWNDPRKDIARKLNVQREMFLVGELDGEVVGTVMAGYDGHRGWVNYLAVDPDQHQRGLGRALMKQVEQLLRDWGCPKVNLQVRATNATAMEFYRRIGYVVDEVVSFGKRLERDS